MSRPTPLQLNGARPPSAAHEELAVISRQLDEAHNVANGARAALEHVYGAQEAEHDLLPSALEDELEKAEAAIPVLEERLRQLQLEIASAVPTPLSPAPPPPSATANGFGVHSSPAAASYGSFDSSPAVNGFSPALPPASLPEDSLQLALVEVIDLLGRLGEMSSAAERIRGMDSIVEAVERYTEIKYQLRLQDYLPSVMGCLAESAGKETRAAVYRLFRHLVVDVEDIYQLNTHHLPLFLIRTLARDPAFILEKEHALRLIRALLPFAHPQPPVLDPDFDPPPDVVPVSVMRAVVAIADAQEDKLRLAALEMLGELLIRNLPLLSHSGGLRVVLQSLVDGPHELAQPLSLLLLHAVDHPDTRQWLRPGVDVEVVLAGFTEVQPKGAGAEERVRACAGIVGAWLKSWSGLFYLNIHGRQALTSLVDSLSNPSQAIRETLLDMLFSVFNVRTPEWYAARGGTRSSGSPSAFGGGEKLREHRRTNLIDQYMAILLLVFIEAGLIDALAALAAAPKDPVTAKKVSLLISEVLDLGNRVLPPQHALRLQALPKLFALTSSFETSDARLHASDALIAVNAFDRDKRVAQLCSKAGVAEENRPRSNSVEDPNCARASSQRNQVITTKLRASLSMDDTTFRNQLLETGVLSTKDHTKWQYDVLLELVEGPLRNPRRLDEATKASKFMRRLLGFFQPFSLRYSELRKEPANDKWTDLGCSLLSTLLSNPDGVQYLAEDKLLRQISDCLFQLDPQFGATTGVETLFSKERLELTLSSGYFEMLGVLTRSHEGVRLLDSLRIWTAFYRVSELRTRDDLVTAILENMDYTLDGHPRVFLSKALTSSYKHVRLFATRHLASLIHPTPSPSTRPSACGPTAEWQLSLLVQQLYDSAPEVVAFTLATLDAACAERKDTLEAIVRMRPALDLLGAVTDEKTRSFLSTEEGVQYLHEIDFIGRELDEWFTERNLLYTVELELALASHLKTHGVLSSTSSVFDGTPPPNFYGELVKTFSGCEILRESGHFERFAETIQLHGETVLSDDYVLTLKSVLWAVGHIGSSVGGLEMLDDEGILADLVQIAAFSPVYSLRGTATYALALISQTEDGAELLDELGWESVFTPISGPTGLCVPAFLGEYIYTPLWDPPLAALPTSFSLPPPSTHLERDVLSALSNLSNHILATKASKTLARLKTRHRSLFASPSLYYRALEMLSHHHYRLAVRKYIIELFDLSLDFAVAEKVMSAGEELKAKKAAAMLVDGMNGGDVPARDGDFSPGLWKKAGANSMFSGADGLGGDETDEDDDSTDGEAEATIPLKVLTPVLRVHGFLLA
ncbi:hypothetical protein JCM10207_002465 [Rhodosporidiobolus poonsookiae]